MAGFSPITLDIIMDGRTGSAYTLAEVTAIPTSQRATVSLVHEYVHYLQATSSLAGYRLMAGLIETGIRAALLLNGKVDSDGTANGYHQILELLRGLPDHAASKHIHFQDRVEGLLEQIDFIFGQPEYPYKGSRKAWEMDQQAVPVDIYDDETWGLVTPRGTFRPFNVGMISENMARRIDRWFAANSGCANPPVSAPIYETEYYNGIRNVIAQPRYSSQIHPDVLDRVTVTMCSLALITGRPDVSIADMVVRLQAPQTAGGTALAIAQELRDKLHADRQMLTSNYNSVTESLTQGDASVMARTEYLKVFRQMKRISIAAGRVMRNPMYFAEPGVDWEMVKRWMREFTLPPVSVGTHILKDIDGVGTSDELPELLREIVRVIF